jgi:hypothetical protein
MVRRNRPHWQGQEIHLGEEAGLIQWRHAIERSDRSSDWIAHGSPSVSHCFEGSQVSFETSTRPNLDTEIRLHLAKDLHRFVDGLGTQDRKLIQKSD